MLNLSDNTFSAEGSAAIAAILPRLQQLRVVNFGECLVRTDGAKAIAEAITDQHQLLEVCFGMFIHAPVRPGFKP